MIRATTILAVRRGGRVAIAGDGQVTVHDTVIKRKARKVRRLYQDRVIAGFAGSAADALALFSKFEGKLEEAHGNLERACYELAKDWRTDRVLRRLEAMMIVADARHLLLVSGTGDLIEPDDDMVAVGSGAASALAAARALLKHTELGAEEIVREAIGIASEICIFTNDQITVEVL
jgi:ATP-dependent HslUV protease subunit HslV